MVATGVTVRKASPDFLMAVHNYSPDGSLDQHYIANYVGLHIRDALLRVPGVGDIGSRASRDYAMRIWIDPDLAAARGLTVEDIAGALKSHNVQVAAGSVGQPPQPSLGRAYQLNIQALGRLTTPGRVRQHHHQVRRAGPGDPGRRRGAGGTGRAGLHHQRLYEREERRGAGHICSSRVRTP